MTRTWAARFTTPSVTADPAMAPIFGMLKRARTSAFPRGFSRTIGSRRFAISSRIVSTAS